MRHSSTFVNYLINIKCSKNFKAFFIILFVVISKICVTQTTPFYRGVNLTEWFQTSSPGEIHFTKFTKEDFNNIKSLGCDVIRLPLNLLYLTDGDPDYILDPLFLTFLDSAVSWADDVEIFLLLDNHSYDLDLVNNSTFESTLIKMWEQLAERYKDRSEYIIYEIQNEPHDISDASWGIIQGNVIEAIRVIDTDRTIIVGPASWNTYNNLQYLPDYDDDNLIYTFHYYEPFLFTHQGAEWTDPSMLNVKSIPFPYVADSMPACPAELSGTWVETLYENYSGDGTGEKLREWLDIAIDFGYSRNVPLYCGEIGVYNLTSPHVDRIAWYDTVRSYLEKNDIAWTIWDYTGRFGLFETDGNDLFEYDLDTALVRALGLIVPPQKEFSIQPDSTGFPLYTDYIAKRIFESSQGSVGKIDLYNTNHPNNDRYCIHWQGVDQYATIGFDLKPDKDLQTLVDSNYALDMMIRCNSPGVSLDIRFMDTKTNEPDDHPWRMRYIIDESVATWDGTWHHIHIPLSEFTEQGSWDGEWYNPIGAYDWTAVDRFEIVAEHHSIANDHFWFDNIIITNMDTARIWDDTVIPYINTTQEKEIDLPEIKAIPNPFTEEINLEYTLQNESDIQINIYNVTGQLISTLINEHQPPGKYSIQWSRKASDGSLFKRGFYYCHFRSGIHYEVIKIVRL